MGVSLGSAALGDTSAGMIRRIQSGDGASWRQFHERCHAVISDWCRWNRVSEADAEDVLQETLLVVVSKIAGFRHLGPGSLRAWLRAIAWRCWCEALARTERTDAAELAIRYQQATDEIAALEAEYERLRQVDILERAMATVRQRVEAHTWQAFWSTAMDGLSGQDAGDALGMTADCVHSARARVQRLISREVRRINNLVPGDGQA